MDTAPQSPVQVPPSTPVQSTEQPKPKKPFYIIGAGLVVAAALLAVGLQITSANSDYICTQVVEETGACTNGAWGAWTPVDGQAGVERRVYTGQRVVRQVYQYLNLRTQCSAGFEQQYSGEASGQSGFHGGSVSVEYAVCQIQETRTAGTPAQPGAQPTYTYGSTTETTAAETTTQTNNVNSYQELLNFLDARLANGQISVEPKAVRRGGTTKVIWAAEHVVSCSITGTNGDAWGMLASPVTGVESGPIEEQTTFTISCLTSAGNTIQSSADVNILPEYREI